eukprot:GHVH01017228.1.p1 GENE.GHVH01017228.1~~GHVH01017228.1.p1  ORF type:complete len:282 (-),score=41.31 GHVH01017228.1:25-825(-)
MVDDELAELIALSQRCKNHHEDKDEVLQKLMARRADLRREQAEINEVYEFELRSHKENLPRGEDIVHNVEDVYRLMFTSEVSLRELSRCWKTAGLSGNEINDLITHLKKCETTIPRQARCSLNFCLQSEDPITLRTALECVKTRNYDKCFLIQSAFVKPDGLLWAEVDKLTSWVDSQQQFVNHSACWESFSLPISAYINAIRGNVEKADIDALLGKIKTEYIPIDLLVSITLCVLSGNPVFIEAVAKLYEAEGRYECEPRDFCCKY